VIPRGGERLELVQMCWGLIPSWWKKTAKEAPSTVNARAETVAAKPMFRAAYKRSVRHPGLRLPRMEAHAERQVARLHLALIEKVAA